MNGPVRERKLAGFSAAIFSIRLATHDFGHGLVNAEYLLLAHRLMVWLKKNPDELDSPKCVDDKT